MSNNKIYLISITMIIKWLAKKNINGQREEYILLPWFKAASLYFFHQSLS